MARKGGSRHFVRLTAVKALPIAGKKEKKWLAKPMPGRHSAKSSVSLAVFLRDVLHVADSYFEAKKMAKARAVLVDNKPVTEEKFAVGFMDVVSFPAEGKSYRLMIDKHGRLKPFSVGKDDSSKKYAKVVKKHTISKGKTNITLHDGRNFLGDNHYKVGDTVVFDLVSGKPAGTIKLAPGSRCLVVEGKHAGKFAKLDSVIERKGSMDPEAKLHAGDEAFTTLVKYLFVVDEGFKAAE
jgi:small subunit ribosomal protein S4e